MSHDLRWQTKHTSQKRSIERRYQRIILRNNNVLVGCGSLKKCVWEESTADFAFVAETRTDYLNTMIERNSNLQIFILHLYFFKDFTNPLRRANLYTYLLTVDSKHIYPKRRANLTCTEVSPKVYGRIWAVLKISTFWFSYFNSGLFAGLYNIFFSITRVSLTQKTL